jgi:hypothetical protein
MDGSTRNPTQFRERPDQFAGRCQFVAPAGAPSSE